MEFLQRRRIKAPDFRSRGPWINSPPLSLDQLKGRVVLVDFWTYSCVNCLRTLPYLKQWHERYLDKALVIVGVHTPEFEFEKDSRNVERFVAQAGIKYPVVLDNDHLIWTDYANRYWPHKYLIDGEGWIRYDHIGEGAYADTEAVIQRLLRELDPRVELPPVTTVDHEHRPGGVCFPTTAELYSGYYRGVLGNPEGYRRDRVFDYRDSRTYSDGMIYLQGRWLAAAEYLRYAREPAAPGDYLALQYHALEVNAVLGPAGGSTTVALTRDDRPLLPEFAGADVVIQDGRSQVVVDRPRMYRLVNDTHLGSHLLKLWPTAPFQIYAFTFGGCTPES